MSTGTITDEVRWELIQATRQRDGNTKEPIPGSPGKAFLRWQNGQLDRVLVLTRDRNFNCTVQRIVGGQQMTVKLSTLRTESEILALLKKRFPQHLPASKPNPKTGELPKGLNPSSLPREVIDVIWEVKKA